MNWDCGCSVMDGRCDDHAEKMALVSAAWRSGETPLFYAVEKNADGFGAGLGSLGGDWSGIRDSTPDAVDAMFDAVTKVLSLLLAGIGPRLGGGFIVIGFPYFDWTDKTYAARKCPFGDFVTTAKTERALDKQCSRHWSTVHAPTVEQVAA